MPDALTYYDQTRHILETKKSLLTNGSIEAAFSGTVSAFDDQFADLNAWTLVGAPTVAANVVTMPAGSSLVGGHPEWWNHSTGSRLRLRWNTGGTLRLHLRPIITVNGLRLQADGTNFQLIISGPGNVRGTTAAALVNGNFYWFQWSLTGNADGTFTVTATLDNDNAGAPGTNVGTLSNITTQVSDNVEPVGRIQIDSVGASMAVGGAFADVCLVKIPAPPNAVVTTTAGTPAFCVSKTNKVSGLYSLGIYNNHVAASADWGYINRPIVSGIHVISALQKTANVVTGTAKGAQITEDIGGNQSNYIVGTTDWQLRSAVGQIGSNTSLRLRLREASGTVWFDNIWLAPGTFIPRSNFK